ncbi:hypothetical protein [Pacificibacter maritimus]|nr:hypothetical protein [Pacificibacter maritimus]
MRHKYMRGILIGAMMVPFAAQAISPEWTAEKCERYTRAWGMATQGDVAASLSDDFVTHHDAFIASGCTMRGKVCPVTKAERDLADILSLMAVAEGATGSFLPFHCDPKPEAKP